MGSDLSCGDPVSSKLSKMFAAVLSTSLLPRSAYLSGTHQREGTADGAEAAGEGVVAAGIEDDMVEAVAGVLDGSQRGVGADGVDVHVALVLDLGIDRDEEVLAARLQPRAMSRDRVWRWPALGGLAGVVNDAGL